MTGAVAFALLAVLAGDPSAAAAAAGDPFREYAWLRRGSAADLPALPDAWLVLDDERRRELEQDGHTTAELLWGVDLWIGGDGWLADRRVIARQFLSAEGIHNAGSLDLPVRATMDRLDLERAFVRLPDGRIREFDLRRVQVLHDQELDVFSDHYRVVVPFEGLVPGATAVVIATRRKRIADWPLPWSQIVYTRWFQPVERVDVKVGWDAGVTPPVWATNDTGLRCEQRGRRLDCGAVRREPLDAGEQVPSFYDLAPHLVVSEPHGWGDVAERIVSLVAASAGPTHEVAAAARRLLDGATSAREKLERIHRFVADEVRYVALQHGTGAVVPAPASRTLDRRYGDCKGKVALFLALARHAGLSSYPVLVATDHHALDRVVAPSWRYFDHMIACTELEGEPEPVCTDLTDPNSGTGSLPPGLYGAIALDGRPGASKLHTLDAPDYVWDIQVDVDNHVACSGKLTEVVERTYRGPAASLYRAILRGLTAEGRRSWATEDYRQALGNDAEPGFTFEGLDDPGRDLVVRSEFEYEGLDVQGADHYSEADSWMLHFGSRFSTENRKAAYEVQGARIRSTSTYRICAERKVRFLGAALRLGGEFGSLHRSYDRRSPLSVTVETELLLRRATVVPEALERYRRFLAGALAQTRIWFDFEPRSGLGGLR